MSVAHAVDRAAAIRPLGIATRHLGVEKTWREFRDAVARLAAGLQSLTPGKPPRVAVLAANSPRHLELMYAVHWCGGVLVPLNTRLALAELQEIAEHAEIEIVVTDGHYRTAAHGLATRKDGSVLVDIGTTPNPEAATNYEELTRFDAIPHAATSGWETAALFYTGGTTGRPKGVMHSHHAMVMQCVNLVAELHFNEETVHLHSGPMFHMGDCMTGHSVTLAGGTHTFLSQFDTEGLLRSVRDEGSNALMLVPTMMAALLDAGAANVEVLQTVRWISYGAAAITLALLARVVAALPSAGLVQCYGQTELCGACTILPPECHHQNRAHEEKLRSAGRPFLTCAIRIVAPNGEELPQGAIGEIVVRSPSAMQGYWKDPVQTAAALRDGWIRTGDVGRLDEDGFVTILDRVKDMIITGGENVFSAEVENALASHPGVAACAVIGVPDERWGEAVHAVVVRRSCSGVDARELIAHCRQQVAGYKCPKTIEFRDTPLPVSGVGKVLKAELRATLNKALDSSIQ